jgi:prepilin-type N-terminal cleavage/methylation domain-containing protein
MRVTAHQQRHVPEAKSSIRWRLRCAFTIIELLIVVAIMLVLAALLLPALNGAKERGKAVASLNNLRQLGAALPMYADDHDDALPPNMGKDGLHEAMANGQYVNWASGIMSWELDSDNTNATLLTLGGIGPYVGGVAKVFKCPSDTTLSDVQRKAGWSERVRSVSLNAMLGNAGEFMKGAVNTNNPDYRQFLKLADVAEPSHIFSFVEEHPDSINDGYFLNRFFTHHWIDLPASDHFGGTHFAYTDGHVEWHRWRVGSTKPAPLPDAAHLPMDLPPGTRGDFYWVLSHTSVEADEPARQSDY